jgi:hypothetical protein
MFVIYAEAFHRAVSGPGFRRRAALGRSERSGDCTFRRARLTPWSMVARASPGSSSCTEAGNRGGRSGTVLAAVGEHADVRSVADLADQRDVGEPARVLDGVEILPLSDGTRFLHLHHKVV